MATTTTNSTATKKINWQFPEKGQEVTVEDFREMVREAERGKTMSWSEFKSKIDAWLKEH
ncbi:MAG: hypothetical protein LBS16_03480 [Prevotellaceae bacterium]|nr:hypothetical protein [Prevotellaceae bacterium]